MFSKYGNLLTMFLVVLIVAILGIGGYFAYDALHAKSVNADAELALEEFKKATTSVNKNKSSNSKESKEENTNTTSSSGMSLGDLANSMAENNGNNEVTEPEEPVKDDEEKQEPEKVYMEKYEVIGRLEIPKTKVNYPVLDGNSKRILEIALGKVYGPDLNKPGNAIIYGHNYRNNLFFSNNKKLSKGDTVYITDRYGERVAYKIYNIYQTSANDASYMTRDTEGRREISLQTCTDDSSARIIIWASAD